MESEGAWALLHDYESANVFFCQPTPDCGHCVLAALADLGFRGENERGAVKAALTVLQYVT